MTSWALRFAEMNARPATHAGIDRPDRKKSVLVRMNRTLDRPAYNLIIHSSPLSDEIGEYYHWHVELIPKLTKVAGFEWGTGFYINPTAPEEAAKGLREARI